MAIGKPSETRTIRAAFIGPRGGWLRGGHPWIQPWRCAGGPPIFAGPSAMASPSRPAV